MKHAFQRASAVAFLALAIPVGMFAQSKPFKISKKNAQAASQINLVSGQTAVVKDAESLLISPSKPCENFAWAAIIETLAKVVAPEVGLSQNDLSLRTFAGDKCMDTLSDY